MVVDTLQTLIIMMVVVLQDFRILFQIPPGMTLWVLEEREIMKMVWTTMSLFTKISWSMDFVSLSILLSRNSSSGLASLRRSYRARSIATSLWTTSFTTTPSNVKNRGGITSSLNLRKHCFSSSLTKSLNEIRGGFPLMRKPKSPILKMPL